MTEERSGKQWANAAAILTPSLDRSSEYVRFAQLATGQSEAPRHKLVEASDLVVGDARSGAPLRQGFSWGRQVRLSVIMMYMTVPTAT